MTGADAGWFLTEETYRYDDDADESVRVGQPETTTYPTKGAALAAAEKLLLDWGAQIGSAHGLDEEPDQDPDDDDGDPSKLGEALVLVYRGQAAEVGSLMDGYDMPHRLRIGRVKARS